MTDIVVCVPQTREGKLRFYGKTEDIGNAFWTMGRTPKNFKTHDWVWFVNQGIIEYGVEVKKIVKGPRPALKNAEGHNPPLKKGGCRLYFFDSKSAHQWTDPDPKDKYFPIIPVGKGFQGFRYKWWDWPWEKENEESINNQEKR